MKSVKEKNFKIGVVNIKLLSNTRSGVDAYTDIIKKIHSSKFTVPVKGGKHAILRTLFTDSFKTKDDVLYGKFSKFTVIDGTDWLNLESMEVENFDIPENKFPNLVESDYIFIPSAHRFAIIITPSVNINAVETFLNEAVRSVISAEEDCNVIIEQSEDVFESIINAQEIQKLLIKISYSNADIGDEAFTFMDNEMKESQIKDLTIEAKPDHNKSILVKNKLLAGALSVAKSNGYAIATIQNDGIKRVIETKLHPKTISITCEESTLRNNVFQKIISLFRSNV